MLGGLMGRVRACFGDMPLFVKSIGFDIVSTLVAANNLILMKDPAGYDAVEGLMKMRSRTYVLPEYHEPLDRQGQLGRRRVDGRRRHGVRDHPQHSLRGPSGAA